MEQTIYYATGNPAKFEEIERFFKKHAPEITLLQFDGKLSEVQTRDQKSIALHKSRRAWEQLHKPLLVDDSGIYFEKYGSFPGTLTKHVFKGIGFEGIMRLVQPGDKASFLLNMIFVDASGEPHIFEGTCNGSIIKPDDYTTHPSFPYDAIFLPDGSDKTYAELRKNPEEAEEFSYRINALKKFLAWLKEQPAQ